MNNRLIEELRHRFAFRCVAAAAELFFMVPGGHQGADPPAAERRLAAVRPIWAKMSVAGAI